MTLDKQLQVNGYSDKKFVIIVLSFQLMVWGSIYLDYIGIKIPILRQLVCFTYLSYIPGIVAMRAFKIDNIDIVETILYAVGLSMSILMLMGIIINTFYPLIGIYKPISLVPLIFSLSLIVILLCALCLKRNNNVSKNHCIELKEMVSIPSLALCLIVPLTVIGTYTMNMYKSNFILMLVILLISLIVILAMFDIIPERLYPFALIVTSISLLLHNSLISMYISGWDINIEYYIANTVIKNSLWNPSLVNSVNAVLSIVMLAPIYSIILDTDLTWIFKIIFPLIFSLLALGLYRIFQIQINNKIAFISVFFFLSFVGFYKEMLGIARQQIAEYFFVLMILTLFKKEYNMSYRILLMIFSFSMIVSHYGLSYIVIGSIAFISLMVLFYQKYTGITREMNLFRTNFIILTFVFLLVWYMNVSSSFVLDSIIHIVDKIITDFSSDLLNPDKAQGLYLLTKSNTIPLYKISKYLHIVTQVFISIGLFSVLFNIRSSNKYKWNKEYLYLSIMFYITLVAAISIPNFSSSLNTSRIYQIALILLSPFGIIGGIKITTSLIENIRIFKMNNVLITSLKTLSIFFAIYLLFNSGWIYEAAGVPPSAYSLNDSVDYPRFSSQDVAGKEWLHHFKGDEENNFKIYADNYRYLLFLTLYEKSFLHVLPLDFNTIPKKSYIYLSSYNILNNKILIGHKIGVNEKIEYISINPLVLSTNSIYNNGGCEIYYMR